ncbi:MAG: radical SAM protein [archaeon]
MEKNRSGSKFVERLSSFFRGKSADADAEEELRERNHPDKTGTTVALVSVPVWTIETPPLNISYLKAYLISKGHSAKCFDINIELYHMVSPEHRVYWQQQHYSKWQDKQKYEETVLPLIVKPYIDSLVDKIIASKPRIVGISVYSSCFTKTLARKIKERNSNILIVAGGQVCVDQLQGRNLKESRDIDLIIKGEGELVLERIANAFIAKGKLEPKDCDGCFMRKDGRFIDCGDNPRIDDINSLPFPDFDDFDLKLYCADFGMTKQSLNLPMILSRGCNSRCDFCLQRQIWGNQIRLRKAENVFCEMLHDKERYGITGFVFADLLLNSDNRELERLCDLIIAGGVSFSWWGSAKVDRRMTPALAEKMKRAGCNHLSIGIESASNNVLREMRKPSTVADIKKFIRIIRKAGITIGSNMIIGHPVESREDFEETLRFVKEMKDDLREQPWPSECTIFEGTDLYSKYIGKEGFTYNQVSDWAFKDNTPAERESRIKAYRELCLSLYNDFKMFDRE